MRLASLLAVVLAGPGLAAGIGSSAGNEGAGLWSRPAVLSRCAGNGPPQVVFPSDRPEHATGAGAVVWEASARCPGGAGARVAPIGARDSPRAGTVPHTSSGRRLAPRGPLTLAAAPAGEVAIAGTSPARPSTGLLIEGFAAGPFSAPASVAFASAPMALATAYLGDVALATSTAGGRGLRVLLQRHYSSGFGPSLRAGGARLGSSTGALAVALDYRSDALAVWVDAGELYARELPASGTSQPIQALARVGADVHLSALLSDDDRAIVAWSERDGNRTSVYLDRSGEDVRFGAPTLVERYEAPDGLPAPRSSPTLVRLSSESVMMAWAGAAHGRWLVRTAAIDRQGRPDVATIAEPGRDLLLEAFAPGPDGDAMVLWSELGRSPNGSPVVDRDTLLAARGADTAAGAPAFAKPELIAPVGPDSDAAVGLDPDSDRALAVWRGAHGVLEYAVRNLAPGR